MFFRFLALNSAREVVRGTIHARDKSEAENEIANKGLQLQLLQEISEKKDVISPWWKRIRSIRLVHRLPSKSKCQIFQEMSILLRSDITVEQALQIVISGYDQMSLEYAVLQSLLRNVQSGRSLSDAMSMAQQNFSYSEINSVRAAEQVGRLGEVMEQLTTASKNIESAKNKFCLAMIYPGIVLLVTIFVMMILNMIVIPQFEEIFFAQSSGELPILTRCVISFCENIGGWTCWLFGAILCLIFFQKVLALYGKNINLEEYFLWRLPVIKRLITDYSLYLFSSIFKMLLSCDLSLQQSISAARNVVLTDKLKKQIDKAIDDVRCGNSISNALSAILSKLSVGIISAGERSGKLEESFDEVSEIYYKSLMSRLTILSSIIEPLLIIFVAVFVGIAIVAIFLPLMNLVNEVKM